MKPILTWHKDGDIERSESNGCEYILTADMEGTMLRVYFENRKQALWWKSPGYEKSSAFAIAVNHALHIQSLLDKQAKERVALPGWVSVEDRLPEGVDWVIISHTDEFKRKCIDRAYFNRAREWMRGTTPYAAQSVTHWMPLPTPPEQETV